MHQQHRRVADEQYVTDACTSFSYVLLISDAAMLLMHGILGEVLGEIRALAAQVPTASANVARFDALRARLATVFDPPKSKP